MQATVPPPTGSPSPGRPRDPRRDAAIREAALTLLAEVGYERMSVDAIAAAAGVSKPTIYRRWAGKQELVADAIRCHPHTHTTAPDTGSLRDDLFATVRQLADHQVEDAQVAAGLASRLRESEELARLVREHAVEAVRTRFGSLVDRAVARGELPARPSRHRLVRGRRPVDRPHPRAAQPRARRRRVRGRAGRPGAAPDPDPSGPEGPPLSSSPSPAPTPDSTAA